MTIYQGFDVLELNYNRIGRVDERVRRKVMLLDPKTGVRRQDEQSPAPTPTRPFSWFASGRAEIAAMRAFLEARKGRAVPFWLPSFQWDLRLTEDLTQTSVIATIQWCRYGEQMFGTTAARRHLALWDLGLGTMEYYRVEDTNDPGDEVTESLTVDPAAVRTYQANRTVISFLKLCRLELDQAEIRHHNGTIAEATINVREIPLEAPL